MEFRPFWELLQDLGIALPEPSKVKRKQQDADALPKRSPANLRGSAAPPDLLTLLSEAVLELAVEESGSQAAPKAQPEHFWVPPNTSVEVAGYSIPGMVYVGEGLSAINNSRASETSLINPQLKVKLDRPDVEGKQMPYSTSYSQMPPACRAAYLQWLSTGRRNPEVYIGYIWLFFYGLERRVLHDLLQAFRNEAAQRQELDQIAAEVEELAQVYGGQSLSGGIRYKAETFLEICQVMRSTDLTQTIDPLKAKPLLLQVGLGQWVAKGQAIPADWALAWYSRLSNYSLPTAATRCTEEFQALFELRYAQKYGEGMKLKAGKAKLTTIYYPASQSFWSRSVTVPLGNLPDVTRFAAKVRNIGEVVDACRTELEPLSRFLGRNPDGRQTHSAIALLPADLLHQGGEIVQQLQQWLNEHFALPQTQAIAISGTELFAQWSGSNPEKLTRNEAIGLSKLLEQLGYGIEPDSRLGDAVPTLKGHVVLFRLPAANPSSLSTAYLNATLLVHLAIVVASGDDLPSPAEQQALATQLDSLALVAAERSRLHAYMQGLLYQKPTLRNLKARIAAVEPAQRPAIAAQLLRVAAADGQVKPPEVQLLEKVYGLLELDLQALYSTIHDFSTARAAVYEPVTVRSASPTRGHAIPSAPQQPGLRLDMALVQSKLVESQEISSLLAEIFGDETSEAASQPVQPKRTRSKTEPKTQKIAGLDAPHSALLLAIAKHPVWQRAELEAIAASLNLMLDGALEVVNEAAFDRLDEALIEGHDSMEVNQEVLRELLS